MIRRIFHTTSIVLMFSIPGTTLSADDDSCEIKKDGQENMSNTKGNKFTRDKTWRFNVDEILRESREDNSNKKEIKKNKSTKTSGLNI